MGGLWASFGTLRPVKHDVCPEKLPRQKGRLQGHHNHRTWWLRAMMVAPVSTVGQGGGPEEGAERKYLSTFLSTKLLSS